MRKIDDETRQRILDATDIVEVVSDFVSLKRRGANYIGLCPFHNERTPSFSVSRSRGICKCFSCGEGGSAVNFIMKIENIGYYDALKYLARKYGIEVKEHEVSAEEREAENRRESMMAVNTFALEHFEHNIHDTENGQGIGLSYFKERGINDEMIKLFHLGYALDRPDELLKSALAKGYREQVLLDTGLCAKNSRGITYDRFKGRVIYPIFSVSGRPIAFGGRTLRSDKNIAKYVNSPESEIYHKSSVLYGLYQAKQSIVRKDKCFLVEGYMDVISMCQAGITNVVASSGTSLTQGQIRLLHRFTKNVTVIYDSDAAGIKASLRGIDLLLAEGLNIKVLLLPDGDDPDTFAQHNSPAFVEKYIEDKEQDFISFKTNILLDGAKNDPLQRAQVITDIINSVACIPDPITRRIYLQECSRMLNIDETTLALQLKRAIAAKEETRHYQATVNANAQKLSQSYETKQSVAEAEVETQSQASVISDTHAVQVATISATPTSFIRPYEIELLRYVVRFGMIRLCDAYDSEDKAIPLSVFEYVYQDFVTEGITFSTDECAKLWEAIKAIAGNWSVDYQIHSEAIEHEVAEFVVKRRQEIREQAKDIQDIQRLEGALAFDTAQKREELEKSFACNYLSDRLLSHPDDIVRELAGRLAINKHALSKIHSKMTHMPSELDTLPQKLLEALYSLKYAILIGQERSLRTQLSNLQKDGNDNFERQINLIQQLKETNASIKKLAHFLGERIYDPTNRK